MTYLIVIAAVALVATTTVFLSGRGLARDITDVRQVVGRARLVNIPAFRQLLDPRDTLFLRSRLAADAFRKLQRLRARAALQYLLAIFHNAAILVRVGELAKSTGQEDLAAAGARLVNTAIHVRVLASMAIGKSLLGYLFCKNGSDESVINRYERLRNELGAIALLQCPGESSRISRSI